MSIWNVLLENTDIRLWRLDLKTFYSGWKSITLFRTESLDLAFLAKRLSVTPCLSGKRKQCATWPLLFLSPSLSKAAWIFWVRHGPKHLLRDVRPKWSILTGRLRSFQHPRHFDGISNVFLPLGTSQCFQHLELLWAFEKCCYESPQGHLNDLALLITWSLWCRLSFSVQ